MFTFKQGDRPLEGYTIQRGVGRGGFGEVYYAISDGGKEIALKYLRENPSIELRGVTACLNLKSPHLVSIFDVKQNADGQWFVLMEYIAGSSLRELMNDAPGGLGPQKAAFILRELGRGLTYLHDRGIVHRDLKPGNVFYDEGYVKIGDYGLSKFMAASQHSGQTVSVGTVHYMAPEIGSGNYDRTIDIYALGVMLYEMLLGRVPFSGATVGEILMKHLTAQPEVDALPAPFPDVIRKALQKDPKDRYQTVAEMVDAVFGAAGIRQSVDAFEPNSLSTAARAAVPLRPGAVVPPVPTGGSSNVGQTMTASPTPGRPREPLVPAPDADGGGRPGRVARTYERVHEVADRVADRIDGTRLGRHIAGTMQQRSLAERVALAALVVVGSSLGLGMALGTGGDVATTCLRIGLTIAAIVQGVLVGCWIGFERYRFGSVWLVKGLIAALVAMVVIPTPSPLESMRSTRASRSVSAARQKLEQAAEYAKRSEVERRPSGWERLEEKAGRMGPPGLVIGAAKKTREAQPIALPLLALLLLGDWPGRYYRGRRGEISLGYAFSAWLFTLIVSGMTDTEPKMAVALIAAAASLATQSVAGLWPLSATTYVPAGLLTKHRRERRSDARQPAAADAVVDGAPPVIAPVVPRPRPTASPAAVHEHGGRGAHEGVERDRFGGSRPAYPARSPHVRLIWSIAGLLMLGLSAAMFAGSGLAAHSDDEMAAFVMAGIFAFAGSVFGFTRGIGKRSRGLWRDYLRPGLSLAGLATSGAAGVATGLMARAPDEQWAGVAMIILGAVVFLGVWLLPIGAARAEPLSPAELQARARRRAGWTLAIGILMLANIGSAVGFIEWKFDRRTANALLPAVIVPISLCGVGLIVLGAVRLAHFSRKNPKLALPLRRVFEFSGQPDLGSVIERHFSALGYAPASRGELYWSFERGNAMTMMWDSNYRKLLTRVNAAAYALGADRWQLRCYMDVETSAWHTPDQKQLRALWAELDELRDVLGARDVDLPAGSSVATTSAATA